jgi:hypothetical protein
MSFAYHPVLLPENPTYIASEDATIIVPTFNAGKEFKEAAHSWLVGNPRRLSPLQKRRSLSPYRNLPMPLTLSTFVS